METRPSWTGVRAPDCEGLVGVLRAVANDPRLSCWGENENEHVEAVYKHNNVARR